MLLVGVAIFYKGFKSVDATDIKNEYIHVLKCICAFFFGWLFMAVLVTQILNIPANMTDPETLIITSSYCLLYICSRYIGMAFKNRNSSD